MDRRTFLLGTGAALAAGATGAPAVAAPPRRDLPVISWRTVGGLRLPYAGTHGDFARPGWSTTYTG